MGKVGSPGRRSDLFVFIDECHYHQSRIGPMYWKVVTPNDLFVFSGVSIQSWIGLNAFTLLACLCLTVDRWPRTFRWPEIFDAKLQENNKAYGRSATTSMSLQRSLKIERKSLPNEQLWRPEQSCSIWKGKLHTCSSQPTPRVPLQLKQTDLCHYLFCSAQQGKYSIWYRYWQLYWREDFELSVCLWSCPANIQPGKILLNTFWSSVINIRQWTIYRF